MEIAIYAKDCLQFDTPSLSPFISYFQIIFPRSEGSLDLLAMRCKLHLETLPSLSKQAVKGN